METGIASIKDLSKGKMVGIIQNGMSVLVANLNGEYFSIGNICTHMGCHLSDGTMKGENVECPCHGSTFNLRTGAVVRGPAAVPEPSYRLKIEDDKVIAVV